MPLYEYVCPGCGEHMEVLRSMAQSEDPLVCATCGQQARRILSVFAAVSKGAEGKPHMVAGGGCVGCGGGGCACAAR